VSIVLINHDKELFYCEDNKCNVLDKRIKHESIVAILDPKKVITHSFKVPLDISKEELQLEVEMKLYDEAGLNASDDYKFDYLIKEKNIEETENMVEAFAVKVKDIEAEYGSYTQKLKHIDLITVPYVTFQGLYERKYLEPKNDVFIQLDKDFAFIVLCLEGKYIYARPISDLNILSSGIDKEYGLDADSYIELLRTKGLDESAYGEDEKELFEIIQSQFQSVYNRINDTVMYNRNIFGFEKADRIFIDCASGWVKGIDTFFREMMFEQAQILSLKESIPLQWDVLNATDTIVAQYAMLHLHIRPNLTIYSRKKPLHQTFLAKLVYTGAVTTLLVSAYPLYLLYNKASLLNEIEKTKQTLASKQATQKDFSAQINAINAQIKEVEDKINTTKNDTKALYDKAQSYLELSDANANDLQFIENATRLMQKYKLRAKDLGKNESGYYVSVYTAYSTRDLVTKFMNDLLQNGYANVKTDQIFVEENRYHATVKVSL